MQIYQIVLLAVIGFLTLSCIFLFFKLRELTFLFISIWGPIAAVTLIFQSSSFSQPLSIIQSVLTVAICLFFIYQRIFKPKKASKNQNADQEYKQENTSLEEPLDSNENTISSDAEQQESTISGDDN